MLCRAPASLRSLAPPPVLAVALLAVALRVGLALATHFTQEDFLITLRYAENIAHGRGFVYNAGERILGTTTPLYTLLLALASWLGLPAAALGKAANVLADGALCIVVYRWLALARQETAGLVAAFLLAINPVEMRVAVSGQESSLVALCGALIWLFYAQRRYLPAFGAAALLFLLRWDGLLLAAVLTAAVIARERRAPWRELGIAFLICLPWLVFATLYFGSPIPDTLAAKHIVYGWYFRGQMLPELPRLLFRLWGTPPYLLLFVCAVLGAGRLLRERWAEFLPPLFWFFAYWLAFLVSKVWLFEWYLTPPLFVYVACAALGIVTLSRPLRAMPRPWLRLGVIVAAAVLCVFNFYDTLAFTRASQALEDHLRRPLGLWLRAHAGRGDRVMLEPIGYIGYFSHLRVLDVTGLVTPSVLRFYRPDEADPMGAIAEADQPEWCVLRPQEAAMIRQDPARGPAWQRDYRLAATFTYAPPPPDFPATFLVFRRAPPAPIMGSRRRKTPSSLVSP